MTEPRLPPAKGALRGKFIGGKKMVSLGRWRYISWIECGLEVVWIVIPWSFEDISFECKTSSDEGWEVGLSVRWFTDPAARLFDNYWAARAYEMKVRKHVQTP